jgi:hypothetical protein
MTVHVVDLKHRQALSNPAAPPLEVEDVYDGKWQRDGCIIQLIFIVGADEHLLNNTDDGPPVAPFDGEIFMPHATSLPNENTETDQTSQLLLTEVSTIKRRRLVTDFVCTFAGA